jgi:hypothetical protein
MMGEYRIRSRVNDIVSPWSAPVFACESHPQNKLLTFANSSLNIFANETFRFETVPTEKGKVVLFEIFKESDE